MYISESPINTLAFSPNGLFLVTGESNGGVSVWNRREWSQTSLKKSTNREVIFEPRSITVSSTGQVVAAGIGRPKGRSMRLWDIRSTGQLQPVRQQIQEISRYPIATGTSEKQRIDAVAFSPNGKVLAAAGRAILSTTQPVTKEQESTYYINFWNAKTGQYLCTLDNSNFSTSSITFTADGTMFAAADPVEGSVRRWSLSTLEPLPPLRHGGQVRIIASSPSGKILLTGGRDRKVKLWQLQTGQEINVFEKNDGEVTAIVFRPDGRAFVTGSIDKSFRTFIYPSR
ncbi:WD40 repeat domain-containing protein [Leptolyngbyaceae cyanobacterium UHCC 1019]